MSLTFGFPPRIISVPLPAILVEIVMAYFRPAWATISASFAAYWFYSPEAKLTFHIFWGKIENKK